MKQTIAQQLNIKDFPFEIKDKNGNEVYFEDSDGYWEKREYDSKGNEVYFEDSEGFWYKQEFDSKGNKVYFENSKGYWIIQEFDSNGNCVYFEDSNGNIIDKRPKQKIELTLQEIANKFGFDVNNISIIEK